VADAGVRTANPRRSSTGIDLQRFRRPLFNDPGEIIGINTAAAIELGKSYVAIPMRLRNQP